jgi:tetratricopeptide (TPR) repeat protein
MGLSMCDNIMPRKMLGSELADLSPAQMAMFHCRAKYFGLFAMLFFSLLAAGASHAQTANAGKDDAAFQNFVRAANAARDAGNVDAALQNYAQALQIDPQWQEGWWNLGTLQYERDHYAEAIPAFRALAKLAPQASPAWTFLGLCEFETKDYASALDHLLHGQALGGIDDPEIARVAEYHLALLLIRAGDFDRANEILARLAKAAQVSQQVKFALGLGLLRIPLLPGDEIDPSREALVLDAGEIAALHATGNVANALAALKVAIAKYPDAPYLRYVDGQALSASGDLEGALEEFRREANVSPKSALAQMAIARTELQLKRTPEALRAAKEAVRLTPDSRDAHEVLAQSFTASGAKREAAEELVAANNLGAAKPPIEDWVIAHYRTHANSRDDHHAGGGAPNAASTDALWNAAMRDYSTEKYAEAIAALKTWLQQNPKSGTGWAVMGLSEFALHDYDNALIHLQRGQQFGLSGSPESVQLAKYSLGVLLNNSAQFNSAEQLLMSTAGPGPLASEVRFALGMSLLHMRRLPDQVEALQRELVETTGAIAVLLKDSKYDQAFSSLDALLKKYPSTPFLHYVYGTALSSLSQFDEAAKQFRAEIALSPTSEFPYIGIAMLELKRHRALDALEPAQRAVRLAPHNATAHYLLGRSYLETGRETLAIAELQTANAITPGSPEVHFSLAKAYAKTNQPAKADEERAIFAQLNALAEQQRGQQGNQAYGAHDAANTGISSIDHGATETPKPQ